MKDVLIGSTTIDLEDRFFSKKWRSLKDIPIEKRFFKSGESTVKKAEGFMWLEIFEGKDDKTQKIPDISPRPPE
jgi:hypothetical protein